MVFIPVQFGEKNDQSFLVNPGFGLLLGLAHWLWEG